MRLEQAILDRLEKRNAQIEMLQQTIQAMSRAADAEREHARQQLAPLIEENKKLAAQIDSDEKITRSNYEHMERQIAALRGECEQMRREVPLESTREGLKNAVAKLQEVTTEKDRMRLQLENARADIKQAMVELDSLGSMAADRATEIRKLMDGHAEDMKAQAELQSKYESLLAAQNTVKADVAMVYQIADKLGRNQAESIPEFIERQALRLAALESKAGPSIDVQVMAHDLGDELEKAKGEEARLRALLDESCRTRIGLEFERDKMKAKLRPLEEFYAILKQYRDQRAIGLNAILIYDHVITVELALSQLTA